MPVHLYHRLSRRVPPHDFAVLSICDGVAVIFTTPRGGEGRGAVQGWVFDGLGGSKAAYRS